MTRRTPRLPKFSVVAQESGEEPTVIAHRVSLGSARTVCRKMLQDSLYAAVHRVDEPLPGEPKRQYAVWLWNGSDRKWTVVSLPTSFNAAHRWAQKWGLGWMGGLTLVWPASANPPSKLLEPCRRLARRDLMGA